MFDCTTSKARYFKGFSHLSLFNEEDRDDTNLGLLVVVFNKVVENWRSYGDNGYGLVNRCVSRLGFNVSFDNESKKIVFLSLGQFLKDSCRSSVMNLNITVNLRGCDPDRYMIQISKGFRKQV